MNMIDKMKLVELYGEYKQEFVAKCNSELYGKVADLVAQEMPRIVDPSAAIDYIDHIADVLRWQADPSEVWEDVKDFVSFFG